MTVGVNIGRAERENLNWIILSALWHASPLGCNEHVLLVTAQDCDAKPTQVMIRRSLEYLEGSKLVQTQREGPLWSAKLTAAGSDVCEYRADAPKGVARPPEWH